MYAKSFTPIFLISKDTNETKVDVKDANEESSSTDDKEVEPEADPEAKLEAEPEAEPEAKPEAEPEADPEADLEAELKTENVPEAETIEDSTETKEGTSTPKVLEPVIIVEDKKDEITTNL